MRLEPLIILAAAVGCVTADIHPPPAPPSGSESLYSATLRVLDGSMDSLSTWFFGHQHVALRIDPRPLHAASEATDDRGRIESILFYARFDSASATMLEARARAIAKAGLATGDMAVFDRCNGTMALTTGTCPAEFTAIAAVAVPDSVSTSATVPAVICAGDQHGMMVLATLLRFERRDGGWVLVKRPGWTIAE